MGKGKEKVRPKKGCGFLKNNNNNNNNNHKIKNSNK